MPLDALCLRAVVRELTEGTDGCRVDKVYQPDRDEVILALRGTQGAKRLLLSVSASAPRAQFIDAARENPAAPPMFCMLLRKHLQGAKISAVLQPALERMFTITFDTTDELGIPAQKFLHCELMGKFSNLILVDSEGRILDALHRIDGDVATGKRQILPGLFYRQPPAQEGKMDLLAVSDVGLAAAVRDAHGEIGLDKWLLQHFFGLSPLLCRELAYRATTEVSKPVSMLTPADRESLCGVISDFSSYVHTGRFLPYLLTKQDGGTVFDFTFLPITQYEGLVSLTTEQSFSALLSVFYEKKVRAERMRRRSQDLIRTVTNARDRLVRKLAAQQMELVASKKRDEYKRLGDLVTANFYQIEKGASKAIVVDYFTDGCPTTEIPLDARLSPQKNAQRYFKLYNKAKTAEEVLTQQLAAGQNELLYLESVLESIGEAELEPDLAQLRQELKQTGYLSAKQTNGKRQREKPVNAKPYHYRTTDGFDVFAGKNNLQNDLLTLKTAYKGDIWFHTQKIHGSHVILVTGGKQPTDEAMTEAAEIAAYHSKGRGSAMVPVDYSEVRNIKKPAGAKPGMVIYHVYKTAYVTPHDEKIERLRVE